MTDLSNFIFLDTNGQEVVFTMPDGDAVPCRAVRLQTEMVPMHPMLRPCPFEASSA